MLVVSMVPWCVRARARACVWGLVCVCARGGGGGGGSGGGKIEGLMENRQSARTSVRCEGMKTALGRYGS